MDDYRFTLMDFSDSNGSKGIHALILFSGRKRAAAVRKTNSEILVNIQQAKRLAAETAKIAKKRDLENAQSTRFCLTDRLRR